MKHLFFLCTVVLLSHSLTAQNHNLKGGFAAQGYDVVSYFQENPLKGNKKYTATHEGVAYKFSSEENLTRFTKNPEKFIPQYGGFCAYAIAKKGEKVGVNPKTYLISNKKLYLFYNSWGVNTLDKWNEEGAKSLEKQADAKWPIIDN
ncbi:MAG: hypothetical protein K0U54_02280 [Bacteroidetes bacterium]|nr:hypothetical protein [Bacteroidota bacterium]